MEELMKNEMQNIDYQIIEFKTHGVPYGYGVLILTEDNSYVLTYEGKPVFVDTWQEAKIHATLFINSGNVSIDQSST